MWSIQAAVANLRARAVRTLRDPANLLARSVRTWKRCTWSSSTITKAPKSRDKRIHLVAGSTIISSLWKRCVWSIEHNHYLPVKSSRVQPQLFSPTLYSLTFWLISNPSPGLSSLLSEPLLSHLLVDLQPFSGNLLSDDIRTIPSSSQTRDVCDQSSTIITSDFVVLSSNSSGRVLVT